MERIKNFVKREWLYGYNKFDCIYLLAMLALQIIVFCIVPDSPLSIIAGIAGVISVVLCAKGKFSFYFRFHSDIQLSVFILGCKVLWRSH